jgi:hypothetical protein
MFTANSTTIHRSEIESDTPAAIAIAIVGCDHTGSFVLTQKDYQTFRYLTCIISKLSYEYRTYEELSYDLKTNFKLKEPPSVQYLMKKITSFFDCDDNTNYCREKWFSRIVPKFIRFQYSQKEKWEGEIMEKNGRYVYQDSSKPNRTDNIIQMPVRVIEPEVRLPQIDLEPQHQSKSSDIRTDYLSYLITKLKAKFGPQANSRLLMMFTDVVVPSEGLFELEGELLQSALIGMYDGFNEEQELRLISLLTAKLAAV